MKKFNLICISGGLLVVISCFIAFGNIGALPLTAKDLPGGAGKIIWIFGALIAAVGVVNKRWLHALSLVLAAFILVIAFKWTSDLKTLQATQGMGSWLMSGGAAVAILGSVLGLIPGNKNAIKLFTKP